MSDTKNNNLTTTLSEGIDYSTLVNIDTITDAAGRSTGPVLNGGLTDDLQPTLSGHIPYTQGYELRIFLNGSVVGYTKVDSNANWSFTPETPLKPGMTCDFQVVLIDAGTNTLYPSKIYTIHTTELNQDTPPQAPVITEVHDDAGTYQGDVAQGGKTDDSQPLISGTADAGSVVMLSVYSASQDHTYSLGSVVADSDGHWSYQLQGKQSITSAMGEWTFTATASNEVGISAVSEGYSVESVASNGDAFTAPVITSLTDDVGLYQGDVHNGGATDDKMPGLHGTGEPGSIITITMDGPVTQKLHHIAQVEVGKDGTWSYQFTGKQALQKGDNVFHVTASDSVDHMATGSDFVVTLTGSNQDDTTAPDAPVITDVVDDYGLTTGSVANGGKTDDALLKISGTAEAGSTVVITHVVESTGATYIDGSVVADASGHWVFDMTGPFQPTFGNRIITATATDAAGNVSEVSDSYVVNFVAPNQDALIVPDAPVITDITDDVGSQKGPVANGGKTDDRTPTLHGTAEAGSVVTIYVDRAGNGKHSTLGSVTADSTGHWTWTSQKIGLFDSTYTYTAMATDAQGVKSAISNGYAIELVHSNQDDTTAPDAPGIAFAQETYDDGTHQGVNNGATIDDATPQLVGAAEPDSIVKVYDGATLIGSVVADAKGAWAFDVPQALADGKHTFTVTATDAAGNTSAHSDNFVLDVETADITPPDAPVITEVYDDVGLTQGPVENGGKTDDDQLKISGTAEANSTVIISHVVEATGNTYVDGSVVADASGHWVFQMEDALQPTFGNRIITATATDAAGNVSAASDGYTVNYVGTNLDDITVPDAPIIDLVEHGEFSIPTPVSNGGIINKDINLMAGDAEPGSLVTIYDGDVVITTCTTDSDGRWTAAYLEVSSEGTHTLTATATDAAGNVSAHTADFVVNVVTSVSGFEDFEQFGDSLLDINSLVTDSGLKIESTKDQDNFNIAGISGADQKDVNHLFNEYNLGLVKFTLPGVADKVSFFGYDIAGNANVHAYDANGNEIAISITYREPTAAEVNALVVIADAYTITPASGQHIASFTVEGYQWIDDISWTSAGAAHATTQSALLTSPDAVDHHDIMTLAQVDDSHKSTAAVDITDHVQNTLHLTLNDILSGAHANLFIQDGHKQLAITGDQGDVVELKVEDLAHNTWQDAGQVTSGGIQYEVYQHTGGDVELLVQHGLELHQVV